MSIIIDYIVILAHDHEVSAQFFAGVMGLDNAGPDPHFAPVRISATFTISYIL